MARKQSLPTVTPFAAPAVDTKTALSTLQSYAQQNPPMAGDGLPFLRLLKGDGWHYGPDDAQVEDDSLWAVNVLAMQHGWSSWSNNSGEKNEKLGEAMVSLGEPLPPKTSLPDTGWEYRRQLSVQMACVTGRDKGTDVQYTTNSYGGVQALERLIAEVAKHASDHPETPIPIVRLSSDHYQHKIYGRTYKPVLEVVEWGSPGGEKTEKEPPAAKTRTRVRRAS